MRIPRAPDHAPEDDIRRRQSRLRRHEAGREGRGKAKPKPIRNRASGKTRHPTRRPGRPNPLRAARHRAGRRCDRPRSSLPGRGHTAGPHPGERAAARERENRTAAHPMHASGEIAHNKEPESCNCAFRRSGSALVAENEAESEGGASCKARAVIEIVLPSEVKRPKTIASASASSPSVIIVARLRFAEAGSPMRSDASSRSSRARMNLRGPCRRSMVSSASPSQSQSRFGLRLPFSYGKTRIVRTRGATTGAEFCEEGSADCGAPDDSDPKQASDAASATSTAT